MKNSKLNTSLADTVMCNSQRNINPKGIMQFAGVSILKNKVTAVPDNEPTCSVSSSHLQS